MKKPILITLFVIMILILSSLIGAGQKPQLSMDEQNVIVNAVIATINPAGMAESIAATVEARVMEKLALGNDTPQSAPMTDPTITATPVPGATATPEGRNAEGRFPGVHAKYVSSYAYTVGSEDNDGKPVFETSYTPNTLFTFDVVYENDGTLPWPPIIEMRNTGSVSTYTGHRPNAIIDTSGNPVLPGQKRGFSISAHGSEELGYHTFYFQLYDGQSGSIITGGAGSFSYLAY